MGHKACFEFGQRFLAADDVTGKDVVEIGASPDGGSMRPYVVSLSPRSYVGVDIQEGPGVDVVCDAMGLCERFGDESFDVVIANELLEHVRDWRGILLVFKSLLRPGGVLIATTRSIGFPFHHAPFDFWRYQPEDMAYIFRDFVLRAIETDPRCVQGIITPGVFVAAEKPIGWKACDVSSHRLYSILTGQRERDVSNKDILRFELRQLSMSYWRKHRFVPYLARDFISAKIVRPFRSALKSIRPARLASTESSACADSSE